MGVVLQLLENEIKNLTQWRDSFDFRVKQQWCYGV
jgi:hypothetical protein